MPTLTLTYPDDGMKGSFPMLPDRDRARLEDKATRQLSDALRAWGLALTKGVTAERPQETLTRLDNPDWPGNIAMRDALIAVLQAAGDIGAEYGKRQVEGVLYGVKFTIPDIDDFDWSLVNTDVLKWAMMYAYELIRGINTTTRQIVAAEVEYFINNSLTINEMRDRLVSATGGAFSPARARRIAVTETTRAYAQGNMAAWRRGKVVKGKEWYTSVDSRVCRFCAPLHGVVVPLDDTFPGGIDGPPAHPGCRCDLLPQVIGDRDNDLTNWRPVEQTDGRFDWVQQ